MVETVSKQDSMAGSPDILALDKYDLTYYTSSATPV